MIVFFKKALLVVISLLVLTLILGFAAFNSAFLNEPLLSSQSENGKYKWRAVPYSDSKEGGLSTIEIADDNYSLNFHLNLVSDDREGYSPFALAEMVFLNQKGHPNTVDLSNYDSVSFDVKCSPNNILTFALYTVDENITTIDDPRSQRISTRYFNCNDTWEKHDIDLHLLDTPEWWYRQYKSELSKQDYNIQKVAKLSLGSSIQSPLSERANVNVMNMELHGRDWRWVYIFILIAMMAWIGTCIWVLKLRTKALLKEVIDKVRKDRPLIAYQQLSIEPQKNREKSALLKLMATEYANADLQVDTVVQRTGINRNKINEILKKELSLTFSAYLNKLRLNEAARLLADNKAVNVSEIAYTVGYKNVPYFNKLFKNEYGCSPKVFKEACADKKEDTGETDTVEGHAITQKTAKTRLIRKKLASN